MEEDKRRYNGGNKNAGRKPKADEQQLVEKLSPLEPLAHSKLEEAIEKGQRWAVQLFFNYMYGKPKDIKSVAIENLDLPLFPDIQTD